MVHIIWKIPLSHVMMFNVFSFILKINISLNISIHLKLKVLTELCVSLRFCKYMPICIGLKLSFCYQS